MNNVLLTGLLIALMSFDAGAGSRLNALAENLTNPDGPVMVVAHRGCWQEAPENSLKAIEVCVHLGADMVELDVRRTADGALVLMHDETLDRTTDGSGLLSQATLSQVRQRVLKEREGGAHSDLTQEKVPLLSDALEAARGRILVNLDMKEELHDQAFAVVDSLGMADHVVMKMRAAPDDAKLTKAAFRNKTYFMPILVEPEHEDGAVSASSYRSFEPVAYEIVFRDIAFLEKKSVAVREEDRRLWVNTLAPELAGGLNEDLYFDEPEKVWGPLMELGVDMIQTDRPESLIRYLEDKGYR